MLFCPVFEFHSGKMDETAFIILFSRLPAEKGRNMVGGAAEYAVLAPRKVRPHLKLNNSKRILFIVIIVLKKQLKKKTNKEKLKN